MNETGRRIRFLDLAKGVGILMVTFGHITELGNPVDQYMSLYKITVFYFISGYLMSYLNRYEKTGYRGYIAGVTRHIAVPYLLFSIAAIMVRVLQTFLRHGNMMKTFMFNFREFITLKGIATLWFLPTLFFAEIILFVILKNSGKAAGKAVFASVFLWPAAVLLYWDHFSPDLGIQAVICKSLVAVWFMAAGFVFHRYIHDRLPAPVLFAAGIILSLITVFLTKYSHHIDFNLMRFGDTPAVFFIGGICGSAGLLLVLEALERVYVPAVLEYFGKNSLILMCAQRGLLILNIITEGWGKVFRLTDVVCKRFYIERLCILVILLVTVYGLTELIDRCKNVLFSKRGSNAA